MRRHLAQISRDAGHATLTTLAVLVGTALALRAGDTLVGWARGVPRGVHLCVNVAEAEARTGLGLGELRRVLSGYEFEKDNIRITISPVAAVAIAASATQGGDGRSQLTSQLSILRSRAGDIPEALRPPLRPFHEIAVPLGGGRMASLRAARQADGTVWQDLEWADGAGKMALRSNGRTVELLRLAKQLAEENTQEAAAR